MPVIDAVGDPDGVETDEVVGGGLTVPAGDSDALMVIVGLLLPVAVVEGDAVAVRDTAGVPVGVLALEAVADGGDD